MAQARIGSTVIENAQPQLDAGRYPVKRVASEQVRVSADVFKEGHDELAVVLRWRQLTPKPTEPREEPMRPLGNDAWAGTFPAAENGMYSFTVEAWPDQFRTWAHELKRKVDAGREVRSELLEGAALLKAAAERATQKTGQAELDAARLRAAAEAFAEGPAAATIAAALDPTIADAASRYPDRSIATRLQKELLVYAERERA